MQCFLVDAFSAGPFTGNPAAVCLPRDGCSATWMQDLAAEWNQSETAFVAGAGDQWNLRWFTPKTEVDLCGHATLAAAHVLWTQGLVTSAVVSFATRSGVLTCSRRAGNILDLTLPRPALHPTAAPEDLDVMLGARLLGVWRTGTDLIVEVDDAATVRGLRPDLVALAGLDLRGVAVTAAGDDGVHDCVTRFFAPRVGIAEDPLTGSIHAALGPLWAKRLGRSQLKAFQASARGGQITIEVAQDSVQISGQCETIFIGQIVVP